MCGLACVEQRYSQYGSTQLHSSGVPATTRLTSPTPLPIVLDCEWLADMKALVLTECMLVYLRISDDLEREYEGLLEGVHRGMPEICEQRILAGEA